MEQAEIDKWIERLGPVKGQQVVDRLLEGRVKMKADAERQAKWLDDEIAKGLKKVDLKDGHYYWGFRYRGNGQVKYIALWAAENDCFMFVDAGYGGYSLEKLPYMADVQFDKYDGFIPYEIIPERNPI